MKKLLLALILVLAASFAAQAADTGNISVKMDGFPSGLGRVSVVLYNSADAFPRNSAKAVKIMRTSIKGGQAAVVFKGIPYGTYAFVVLHDANANGKMDTDAIGRPKEAYAFSNNATGMVGAPSFGKASFKLDSANVSQSIEMIEP